MKCSFLIFSVLALIAVSCSNNNPESLKSISLNQTSLELETGDTYTLKVKTDPEDADVQILWESSKPAVVSVTERGKITALRTGRATITAFAGKIYADCEIKVVSPALPEISISPEAKTIPAAGADFKVNVNTTHPWKATWDKSWVTLSETEATGSKTITVTVDANETFTADKAEITFTAGGVSKKLTINREGRTPEAITVNPNVIDAISGGGSYKVKVLSTIQWTATPDESWVNVTPNSGTGDSEITVTVDPSNTTSNTQQKIVFDNGENTTNLTVNRAGRDPLPIILSTTQINAPIGGGTYSLTVTSELDFTMTPSTGWVTVSKSGNNVTVVVAENSDGSHMGAQVLFKTEENSAVLNISQQAPTLSLSTNVLYSSDEGAELNFSVNSNYKWTASSSASWVTLDHYSGTGNLTVKVTADEATSSAVTTAIIKVKCANLTSTLQVVRSGYDAKCFTVSNFGTKVYFAPANLYYTAISNKFSFAPYQYSYIGNMNANISATNSSPIDLFGRGTSGYKYKPYTYTDSNIATNYCPKNQAQYLTGTQHDWGYYNAIGPEPAGTWRTPSYYEWEYLLKTRKNSATLRSLATIQGVCGLIILPDHFEWPSGVTKFISSSSSFTQCVYNSSEWAKMEAAGAVFLPATGKRDEQTVSGAGSEGYYWTDEAAYFPSGISGYGSNIGYVLYFGTSGIIISKDDDKGMVSIATGCAVRLVKEKQAQG